MSRLNTALEKSLYTSQIQPVVIQTYPGKLMELYDYVSKYFTPIKSMERGIISEYIPKIFTLDIIKTFNMIEAILPVNVIEELSYDYAVKKIYLNKIVKSHFITVPEEGIFESIVKGLKKFTTTYYTRKILGAELAETKGITGRDVKVGVIDTGCSRIHEQVRGKVKFHSTIFIQHRDENGHGTHCSTTIAGREAEDEVMSRMLRRTVKVKGIAPGSYIYAVKSLGYILGIGSNSRIIKGLEYLYNIGVDVINLSLGTDIKDYKKEEDDPFYEVINKLVEKNIIVVASAGNSGPEEGTINSPAWLSNVLAVGAYSPITGEVCKFSSRGPTPDGRIKPDCIEPGENIHSGCVGELDLCDRVKNNYAYLSGTSMATPHATGLIALAKQAYKEFSIKDVFNILRAYGVEKKSNDYGYGVLTWNMIEDYLTSHVQRR